MKLPGVRHTSPLCVSRFLLHLHAGFGLRLWQIGSPFFFSKSFLAPPAYHNFSANVFSLGDAPISVFRLPLDEFPFVDGPKTSPLRPIPLLCPFSGAFPMFPAGDFNRVVLISRFFQALGFWSRSLA